MPALKTYRLFVSHAWDYHDEYRRFIDLLDNAPLFEYSNYSRPRDNPLGTKTRRELEEALRNQIRPTQIVIILAGMYVAHSDWIQKEIDIALEMVKPILGVEPWGSQRIPTAVQAAADELVGWRTSSIVEAIRRIAL